jgi:hypothetical protein
MDNQYSHQGLSQSYQGNNEQELMMKIPGTSKVSGSIWYKVGELSVQGMYWHSADERRTENFKAQKKKHATKIMRWLLEWEEHE